METIYKTRRDKLKDLLQKNLLDALIISYDVNRYYLSGFELHDTQSNESSGYLIIGSDGNEFLATDPRFEEVATSLFPENSIYIYKGDPIQTLYTLAKKCGVRIGVETDLASYAFVEALKSNADIDIVACNRLVESLRVIKDRQEIEKIEKSFALNHTMLLWLEKELQPGRTEREISWCIEKFFRENGASELAFPSIVAVDKNAAMPHAIPGETEIKENSLVLVDVGCRVEGYCSDQTRTFWIGEKPTDRFQEALLLVQEAQKSAIAAMHPGMRMVDIYNKAYDTFEQKGLGNFFTHGLGHGVGLETHEAPAIGRRSDAVLQPGMVVTVEPGLYFKEWGGIRWEHTVLVEEQGVRVL
ncbi:MAG: aminopeptidase P family protein [Desulfovibrio sp.]|nr:aminopeptidase P family protein [Desulfovibrio sp.]